MNALNLRRPARLGATLVGTLVLLAACASAPDRYYTLSAPGAVQLAAAATPTGAPSQAIEFAPVGMPERLARPQMVVRRSGSAEVQLLEGHRWAASLEQEMRDALSTQVARQLGAADVTRGGRAPGQNVWRVAVQVQTLDAVEDESVQMQLQWRLRKPDGSDAGGCNWNGRENAAGGMEAIAAATQRLTSQAAASIATQIGAVQAGRAINCT